MLKNAKKYLKNSTLLLVIGVSLLLGCPASGGNQTTLPISSSIPASGATNFSADGNITLTYNQAVVKGSGAITLLTYLPSVGKRVTIAIDDTQVSIVSNVVTIDPPIDLDMGIAYILTIPAGVFLDAAGGNAIPAGTLFFSTAPALDATAPTLDASLSVGGATDLSADANIIVTFDEPVVKGSGNLLLTPTVGTPLTIAVADPQVSVVGRVVTIDPTDNLDLDTSYVLTIPAGAFMDASGNPSPPNTLSFMTAMALDTTAPTVNSSVPAQDGTAVIATNIVLTYSEAVQGGTGSITITPMGGTPITIPVADTVQVSVTGAVVTINPTNDLMPNVRYSVSISAGALEDLSGNAAGVYLLTFNTTSNSIPSVISSVPSSGATDFENTANIVLTYSEAVQASSGNITIAPASGSPITIAVTDAQVSIAGNVVTINPTNDLAVSTTYTVTVPANAFESSDDQTDAGQFILPFSSAAAPDTTPPMVSLSVPASGGTINALDDIVLTFSETVQRGTGNILITIVGITTVAISVTDTSQVSILGNVVTLSSIVGSAGEYEMIVPAGSFVDLAGNASARFMLSFTANAPAETTPPTISSIAPAQNATNVALDSDIVVFYSEFVQSGTGNITITPMGGTPITIAVGDAQVSILGIVVTINPTADFEPNTVYTVSIPAGAITDGAATPNPAALYTLTFTTTDATRTVVLWVGRSSVASSLINLLNDTTGCQNKPSVATGTVTRRFVATGDGANQNPANFAVDNTSSGGLLSAYTGATSVYAAHSGTTVLTDNDLVANSYAELISPTTDLLRTLNEAGLNGEAQRSSSSANQFWTGITNLQSAGGYEVRPACLGGSNLFWNDATIETTAGVGTSNSVLKVPHDGNPSTVKTDVFAREFGCTNSYNVVCMTY